MSFRDADWLYLVAQGRCTYCGGDLSQGGMTVDHIIPRSWGGPRDALFNKAIACHKCNNFKGSLEVHVRGSRLEHRSRLCEKVTRFIQEAAYLANETPQSQGSILRRMADHVKDAALCYLWSIDEPGTGFSEVDFL